MEDSQAKAEGPVIGMIHRKLRALKKKTKRIAEIEQAKASGKVINTEQEEVLKSKPQILLLIEEYEKLCDPLATALKEETEEIRKTLESEFATKLQESLKAKEEDAAGSSVDKALRTILEVVYVGNPLQLDDVNEDVSKIRSFASLLLGGDGGSEKHGSHADAVEGALRHALALLEGSEAAIGDSVTHSYGSILQSLHRVVSSEVFTSTMAPLTPAASFNSDAAGPSPSLDLAQNASPAAPETLNPSGETTTQAQQADNDQWVAPDGTYQLSVPPGQEAAFDLTSSQGGLPSSGDSTNYEALPGDAGNQVPHQQHDERKLQDGQQYTQQFQQQPPQGFAGVEMAPSKSSESGASAPFAAAAPRSALQFGSLQVAFHPPSSSAPSSSAPSSSASSFSSAPAASAASSATAPPPGLAAASFAPPPGYSHADVAKQVQGAASGVPTAVPEGAATVPAAAPAAAAPAVAAAAPAGFSAPAAVVGGYAGAAAAPPPVGPSAPPASATPTAANIAPAAPAAASAAAGAAGAAAPGVPVAGVTAAGVAGAAAVVPQQVVSGAYGAVPNGVPGLVVGADGIAYVATADGSMVLASSIDMSAYMTGGFVPTIQTRPANQYHNGPPGGARGNRGGFRGRGRGRGGRGGGRGYDGPDGNAGNHPNGPGGPPGTAPGGPPGAGGRQGGGGGGRYRNRNRGGRGGGGEGGGGRGEGAAVQAF